MVQDGGKKKKNKNKKNKNKQNTTNTDQEQSSTSQQHVASPETLADQGAVAGPIVDESFEIVSNEEPIANTNTAKLEIVNGLFSNSCTNNQFDEKINNKNATLKTLALEAKEWMGYDFAAIQDAETKYHIHLAKKQKVKLHH